MTDFITESDTLTLDAIRAAADIVRGHRLPPAYLQGDRRAYLVMVSNRQFGDMLKMEARDNWYDYYRAVRTIQRLRTQNMERFLRFSSAWWHAAYKNEDADRHLRDAREQAVGRIRAARQRRHLP